ncbi:AAA family ATPase, partial [Kitasatospora nipponensis]|uniref:AAA family ATPase n=1 Tax=Kitasatospora nipponensis TaxID=258049 RepID=UPI0031CE8967
MSTILARAAREVPRSLPPGREREFGRLREALDRCLGGAGGVVALNGSVGSGRSELLDAFSELAADQGAKVLVATGSPLEREFPLGLVQQLLQSAGLTLGADDPWQLPDQPDPARPAHQPRLDQRTLHLLCARILALAERAPVLIAVDDRQDADVPSLEFLLYLVRRTRSARVLTVLSSRETMTPPNPFFEVELARQPHHERVRLGLLPVELVADLLTERFGARAAARLTPQAHALTGGNPLLVRALMEDQGAPTERQVAGAAVHGAAVHGAAAVADGGPAELLVGESYRRGLMNCLHRMDPLALRCARGVAVLGPGAEPAQLAELLLLAPDSLARARYLLDASGLFGQGGFRHPSGAGDLLAAMSPAELAGLHERAAQVLRAAGALADRLEEQLLAAEGHKRAPWAVPPPRSGPARDRL